MKKSTTTLLTLVTCAGAGAAAYLYLKKKNSDTELLEVFSEDFYDEVSDGAIQEQSD